MVFGVELDVLDRQVACPEADTGVSFSESQHDVDLVASLHLATHFRCVERHWRTLFVKECAADVKVELARIEIYTRVTGS